MNRRKMSKTRVLMASTDILSHDSMTRMGEDWDLRPKKISPLALAVFVFTATFVGLILWLSIAGDPNGGEPRVVIPLTTIGSLNETEILLEKGENGVVIPSRKPDVYALEDLEDSNSPWSSSEELNALRDLPTLTTGDGERSQEAGLSASQALRPVPDPALIEQGPSGPIPIIAADGRTSMEVYGRPFVNDGRPRIALVMRGLGLSTSTTDRAISTLPPDVTLSFVPYPEQLQSWVNKARNQGHEVMLELPMEPFDYPNNDPGPFTLLTNLTEKDNTTRLKWLLSRVSGYVGVTNYLGAKFTATSSSFTPILKQLSDRGLFYLADGTSQQIQLAETSAQTNLVWSATDRNIDYTSPAAVELDLLQLETLAREDGYAVGTGFAFPVVIDQISYWSERLEQKGIVLAPISSIALDR